MTLVTTYWDKWCCVPPSQLMAWRGKHLQIFLSCEDFFSWKWLQTLRLVDCQLEDTDPFFSGKIIFLFYRWVIFVNKLWSDFNVFDFYPKKYDFWKCIQKAFWNVLENYVKVIWKFIGKSIEKFIRKFNQKFNRKINRALSI